MSPNETDQAIDRAVSIRALQEIVEISTGALEYFTKAEADGESWKEVADYTCRVRNELRTFLGWFG